MLIVHVLKVFCFVTLLQVLIPKDVIELGGARHNLQSELPGYPPPRVFPKKRLDLLDCKGVDFFGDAKEAAS